MEKTSRKRGWKVAAVGELMVSRPFSMYKEEEFLAIKEKLEKADVAYGHLEMNFIDEDNLPCAARGDSVASYMNADPAIAKDIKWLGVDVMSLANNHSYDFGGPGLMENRRHCIEAGIASAGTGCSLDEAGAPAFFESEAGRVALISTSTGNKNMEWANLAKGKIPARPGVNPLRVHTRYHVTHDVAEAIKKMCREFRILTTKDSYGGFYLNEGEFVIGTPMLNSKYTGCRYIEDEKFSVEMYCDEKDLERIVRTIKSAKKTSDLVMIAHHYNVSEGPRGDQAPDFARDFAHAAIDAGADIYFGHGWHRTLGIEIYKGKPIIHNVGDAFAQSQFLKHVPYDSYETWGHDMEKTAILMSTDEPLHPGIDKPSPLWWCSAVYEFAFDENKNVKEIKLTPVELGRDFSYEKVINNRPTGPTCEGRPLIAHGQNAQLILDRFVKLSKPYGVEFSIEGEVAFWRA